MSDHVKRLPPGALPEGGVASWSVADAERWRKARVPVVFAPVEGSWVLLVLVTVSYVLTGGLSILRWSGGGSAHGGTHWLGYPAAVLLAALPLWYCYLPVPTVPATVVVAADAAVSLASPDVPDAGDRLAASGYFLALVVSAWAFTGACLRLRARRRQRALALAAAGRRRRELPDGVPETDGYRGYRQFYLGLVLCLIAGAVLTDGLVEDLTAPDRAPYDAVGQQIAALLFLVPGTVVYGHGHVAFRAARRLHEQPQPALMVGVRIAPDGCHWLYPDARATSGRPLIADEWWAASLRQQERSYPRGTGRPRGGGARGQRSGRPDSWGGGDGCGSSHSCGGHSSGGHSCGGHGCGGHGCGGH
ncbi:hypothetical protein ACH4YO_14625 [Streptomyces noursei]|uniref:hypothetical protein n=1 Tax=Streptomyces noursei TaxID=1971 RepID=UPI0033E32C25